MYLCFQERSTELLNMRLDNLQPNVLYKISLTCRPTAGSIYSEAVSTSLKTAEKSKLFSHYYNTHTALYIYTFQYSLLISFFISGPEYPAKLVNYQLVLSTSSVSSTLTEATSNISLVWQVKLFIVL